MASRNSIQIILSAVATGVDQTFTKTQKALAAFNREVGNGDRIMGSLRTAAVQTIGALAGFSALRNVGQMLIDADRASSGLESSLVAANREFDVGTLQNWEGALTGLRSELKIFSNSELKAAAAGVVNLTSRLGLNQQQMLSLLEVAGNLGGTKMDLARSTDILVDALSGSSKAASELGLTLGDKYVEAWHDANAATEKAWDDLTEFEKVQVRLNIILEQAAAKNGAAGKSVMTFAGAYAAMKANIHDAVTENENAVAAMSELATVLRENGDEIAAFVAQVVGLVAWLVKFGAEHKNLVLGIGGIGLGLLALSGTISTVTNLWRGFNAATMILASSTLPQFIYQAYAATTVNGVLRASLLSLGTAVTVLGGVILAAGIGYAIGTWLNSFETVRKYAQIAIGEIIVKLKQLQATYYEVKIAAKGLYGGDTSADERKLAAIEKEISLYRSVIADIKRLGPEYDKVKTTGKRAHEEIAESANKSAEKQKEDVVVVTDDMKKAYKGFRDEVIQLQNEIADNERSLQAELRDMARGGMSDIGAWRDRKTEADEYYAAAQKAATAGDFEAARQYANMAKEAYKGLNTEVTTSTANLLAQKKAQLEAMDSLTRGGKVAMPLDQLNAYKKLQQEVADLAAELRDEGDSSTTSIISEAEALTTAMGGVKKSGELANDILEKQKALAEEAKTALDKESKGKLAKEFEGAKEAALDLNKVIQDSGGDWGKVWDEMERDAGLACDASERRIKELTRDRHIRVFVDEIVKKALGGPVGFARGGRLPGYGGGDRIHALLEAGEFIIRKEAVRRIGLGALHAINSLRIPKLPALPRFASGGPVGAATPSSAAPTMTVDLRLSDGPPVRVWTDQQGYDAFLRLQAERARFASS